MRELIGARLRIEEYPVVTALDPLEKRPEKRTSIVRARHDGDRQSIDGRQTRCPEFDRTSVAYHDRNRRDTLRTPDRTPLASRFIEVMHRAPITECPRLRLSIVSAQPRAASITSQVSGSTSKTFMLSRDVDRNYVCLEVSLEGLMSPQRGPAIPLRFCRRRPQREDRHLRLEHPRQNDFSTSSVEGLIMRRFALFFAVVITAVTSLALAPVRAVSDPMASPAASASPSATPLPDVTTSGIALDAPWKKTIYAMVHAKFVHPAWGWQHSERNYLLGLKLAEGDGLTIDRDVLFAACFLHDMSAFDPKATDDKMEHGDYAAIASEPILRDAGFPMDKYPRVAAAERAHMFYRDPGTAPESIVLHDADSLDFLGDVGATRMLSLIGEKGASVGPTVKTLRTFAHDIPPKLVTKTARAMGATRAAELTAYLDALDGETFGGDR